MLLTGVLEEINHDTSSRPSLRAHAHTIRRHQTQETTPPADRVQCHLYTCLRPLLKQHIPDSSSACIQYTSGPETHTVSPSRVRTGVHHCTAFPASRIAPHNPGTGTGDTLSMAPNPNFFSSPSPSSFFRACKAERYELLSPSPYEPVPHGVTKGETYVSATLEVLAVRLHPVKTQSV